MGSRMFIFTYFQLKLWDVHNAQHKTVVYAKSKNAMKKNTENKKRKVNEIYWFNFQYYSTNASTQTMADKHLIEILVGRYTLDGETSGGLKSEQ